MRVVEKIGIVGGGLIVVALALAWATTLSAQQTPPWADPGVVSVNRMTSRAPLDPLGPPNDLDRWQSDLNGTWRFLYLERASEIGTDLRLPPAADPRWSEIVVPGSWQTQGFGATVLARSGTQNPLYATPATTSAGVYVRGFTVPSDWAGRRVFLRLGRTRASVTVHLNGAQVGYSENAEAGAEFDLNRHLIDGVNRLTLVVTQWSTSSEHLGTHWADSGLLGGVDLVALPAVSLRDVAAIGRFDPASAGGTLDLRVWLRGSDTSRRGGYRVETTLAAPDAEIVGRRFRQGIFLDDNDQASSFLRLQVPTVAPWSAYSPALYTLEIELLGPDGTSLQHSRIRAGFRSVEFGAPGLLINGEPEMLRGVFLDADLPLTIDDPAAIDRHLQLMKVAGINAVRVPSPLGQRWLDRLDSHGFYAIHDLLPDVGFSSSAPAFERAKAMVEAAKNHPSTVAWAVNDRGSAGAVSPSRRDLRAWLGIHDADRAVLPNRAFGFIAKPRAWQLSRRVANADKALLLWPFGSLLGNSGGGLARLWESVEREPRLIGGFLPQWMVSARSDDGTTKLQDAVARGLLDADGRPLPQYAVAADLYRQLTFEQVDLESARFRLVNRSRTFIDTGMDGRWTLRQDGSVVAAGRLPRLGVGAGEAVEFTVPGLPSRAAAAEYHLSLYLQSGDGHNDLTSPRLASAQFELPVERQPAMLASEGSAPSLTLDEDSSRIELTTRDLTFRIDRTSGTLRYLALRGRPLVNDVVVPALWRMPSQLERANGLAAVDQRLQDVFGVPPADWVGRRVSPSAYSSVSEYTVLDEGLMRIQTTAHGSGAVELSLHWLGEPATADPPRFGVTIPMGPRPATVEWFGRGPGESYSNRVAGTEVGRWKLPLPLANPYHWIQAHGLRSDVRWLAVWFSDGTGLLIVTPPTSSFSIANHAGDWIVDVDAQHRGVGGERDDAVPTRAARIPPGDTRATFLLMPLPAGSDPQQLFRSSAPTDESAADLGGPIRRPRWSLGHLGRGKPLNLVEADADVPPTRRSPINDGWIGSIDAFDGNWQPIDSLPAEITVDLETVETVRRLRLGLLADPEACADLPPAIEFSYSTDRRRWVSLEVIRPLASAAGGERLWLNRDLLGRPLRWVRARILDPETVCANGDRNRVLVDELVVE